MIEVNNVSMRFRMANDRVNSLKEYFVTLMERRLKFEEFQVLDRISFDVSRGEVVGIVGKTEQGRVLF